VPEERQIRRVEDYTVPFLVSSFVILLMVLFALWAIYGLLPTLFIAWFTDRVIVFSSARRGLH